MPSRRLHPDVSLEIKLSGNAARLAQDLVDVRPAVAQLRVIADGRGRCSSSPAPTLRSSSRTSTTSGTPSKGLDTRQTDGGVGMRTND